MMNTGHLQRRWSEQRPEVYDKEERMVYLDIQEEQRMDEDGKPVNGYSYCQVQIDSQIDYGHIKSQLIEAGFAQKDEFGLIMNAASKILLAVAKANTFEEFKSTLATEDIKSFGEFTEYRVHCGDLAKKVMEQY